jgi:hypothetical protein
MLLSRTRAVLVLVGVMAVGWAAVGRSQSTPPGMLTPGAAPVQVVNELSTKAAQAGPWQVSLVPGTTVGLARDTTIHAAPPDLLRLGRRYLVHPSQEPAGVFSVEAIDHGWVRVIAEDGARRWLNLGQIISISDPR